MDKQIFQNHAPTFQRETRGSGRLSEKERLKSVEMLGAYLDKMHAEVNADLAKYMEKPTEIVNSDMSINMDAFATKKQGPYKKTRNTQDQNDTAQTIADDNAFVQKLESNWSDLDDPKVQAHYRNEYGCTTKEEMIAQFKKNEQLGDGHLLELAVTAVLYKVLHSDFVVVRTAKYDDYAHGADNLLVDRKTGNVICSFDQVNDSPDGARTRKKIARQKHQAGEGTEIRYGITLHQDDATGATKLERKTLSNVPSFYLALDQKDLVELIHGLDLKSDKATAIEEKMFEKLVKSLEIQAQAMQRIKNMKPATREQLNNFVHSLGVMKYMFKGEVQVSN